MALPTTKDSIDRSASRTATPGWRSTATVMRCRHCRTAFAWPQPERAGDAYEESYFRAYQEAGLPQVAAAHLDRLMRRLQTVSPSPGRLLDVGVGGGEFLRAARQRGWSVVGLDVSTWAATEIRAQHGIEVLTATLEEAPLPRETFDVVHMSHVLEHLPSYRVAQRCANRNDLRELSSRYVLISPECVVRITVHNPSTGQAAHVRIVSAVACHVREGQRAGRQRFKLLQEFRQWVVQL